MARFRKSCRYFTLIELMAAMGVFSIIMLIVLTFFVSAQKAMSLSTQRTLAYENARIALDLIARDLQCAYYENNRIPFWFKGYTQYTVANAVYNQEALCFISATSLPPNNNCSSNLCEIKYQLYNATNAAAPWDPQEGWLLRSATGNTDDSASPGSPNPKWNFYNNITVGLTSTGTEAFTADGSSSGDPVNGDFHRVIPYVTRLEFSCFRKDGTAIPPDTVGDGTACEAIGCFPYEVKIDLTLMDGSSWAKWKAMGGLRYASGGALIANPADDFRQKNERTFSKTVLIGERGQAW